MLDRLPQKVIAPETGISRKRSRISGSQQNKTNLISVTVMTVVQPLKILIQKRGSKTVHPTCLLRRVRDLRGLRRICSFGGREALRSVILESNRRSQPRPMHWPIISAWIITDTVLKRLPSL
jgi:hypothetical protein